MRNWKTTLAGIGMVLGGAAVILSIIAGGDGDASVAFDKIVAGVGMLIGGSGLVAAADGGA
jgi:hypothetical protein